jgi:hypothetical protein
MDPMVIDMICYSIFTVAWLCPSIWREKYLSFTSDSRQQWRNNISCNTFAICYKSAVDLVSSGGTHVLCHSLTRAYKHAREQRRNIWKLPHTTLVSISFSEWLALVLQLAKPILAFLVNGAAVSLLHLQLLRHCLNLILSSQTRRVSHQRRLDLPTARVYPWKEG